MKVFSRFLKGHYYGAFRREVCCRLGIHGPRTGPDGKPANVCGWGCGLVYNPAMWQNYLVVLKDGQEYEVQATNEFHAGSMVVYGLQNGGKAKLDGRTGKPLNEMKVHRDNIERITLNTGKDSSYAGK